MCKEHQNDAPELEGYEAVPGVKPGDLKPADDFQGFSDLEDDLDVPAGPDVKREITEEDPGPFATVTCPRCHGSGIWRGGFSNYVERTCFACNGTGRAVPRKPKKPLDMSPKAVERRAKARTRRREKKVEEAQRKLAAHEEFKANDPMGIFLVEAAKWSEFAVDMLNAHYKYEEFTERQEAAVRSMMEKVAARKNREADAELGGAGLDAVMKIFSNAIASGLKRPVLRIGDIKINLAPAGGKNAGHLYVKLDDEYQGKIDPEGKWFAIRAADESIGGRLEEIAKDPLAAAVLHGKRTGNCACCGRELTDPKSVERGIGPICADKWGL